MNKQELNNMFLNLSKWSRRNKDKITHPIRTKHFLQDLAYILYILDEDNISPKIKRWRNESTPKYLIKLFGIKK